MRRARARRCVDLCGEPRREKGTLPRRAVRGHTLGGFSLGASARAAPLLQCARSRIMPRERRRSNPALACISSAGVQLSSADTSYSPFLSYILLSTSSSSLELGSGSRLGGRKVPDSAKTINFLLDIKIIGGTHIFSEKVVTRVNVILLREKLMVGATKRELTG